MNIILGGAQKLVNYVLMCEFTEFNHDYTCFDLCIQYVAGFRAIHCAKYRCKKCKKPYTSVDAGHPGVCAVLHLCGEDQVLSGPLLPVIKRKKNVIMSIKLTFIRSCHSTLKNLILTLPAVFTVK